jgi:hypothetical protein
VTTCTCEAFADAVDRNARCLDSCCAALEKTFSCLPVLTRNRPLLSTKKPYETIEMSLEVLLEVVWTVFEVQYNNGPKSSDSVSTR